MARKNKRNAPSSPEEIAARRAVLQGAKAEASRLRDQGAEVVQDPRTLEVTGAYKPDVVVIMRRSDGINPSEESAVRRFERLIADANGGSHSSLGVLDRVQGGDVGDGGIGSHVDAAIKLQKWRKLMDPMTWALARELCDGNLLVDRWRGVIHRRTGETNEKAQAGIVRHTFRVIAIVADQVKRETANDDRPPHVAVPLAG